MRIVTSLSVLITLAICIGLAGQEPSNRDAKFGQFKVTLPATWQLAKYDSAKKSKLVATRKNKDGTKQIGEILASPLPGSVEKETSELLASVKKNAAVVSVDESGEFVTRAGVKGKKILLIIKAEDPDYGSPIAFYSIYLPHRDGTSLTVKLRCGKAEFAELRREIDDFMTEAK